MTIIYRNGIPDGTPLMATGATFSGGIGDAWTGDPPVIPGVVWRPTGGGNYAAYSAGGPRPQKKPPPKKSGGGSGGGGWSGAWNDFFKMGRGLMGEVAGIQGQARTGFESLMKEFGGAKDMATADFNDIRKRFDSDIAGMPSVSMKLPAYMGGSSIPLAPGKFQQMYSNIANTRTNTASQKIQSILAALTGKTQAFDSSIGRQLQGSGIKGDVLRGMSSYDLGLRDIAAKLGIARGQWENNLALQKLRNAGDVDVTQRRIDAANNGGGSSYLPQLLGIGGMIAGGYFGSQYPDIGIFKGAGAGGALGSSIGGLFS